MKKGIIIGLLSIYACSQVGPAIWAYSRPVIQTIFSARHRIRSASRNSEELLVLETDMQRLRQMRQGNHEIVLNGVLHDIEKVTITGNRARLVVRKDEEETSWLRICDAVNKWLQKKSPRQNESSDCIGKWLLKIYCVNPARSFCGHIDGQRHQAFPGLLKLDLPISPYLTRVGRPPDSLC